MATAKTETTELSLGFGLLGLTPGTLTYDQIAKKFTGSLSKTAFDRFLEEFRKDRLYMRMHEVGRRLRELHPPFRHLEFLVWSGPDRQAATTSTAKDLFAANTPISVKAESGVVGNPSPYNLFIATPQGGAQARGMGSWYVETALNEYQALFSYARNATGLDSGIEALPADVTEFEKSRNKKLLRDRLKLLSAQESDRFFALYIEMCRKVSTKSAELSNAHFTESLSSKTKNTVLEHIAKMFFRMDAVPYLLAGIDGRKEFAVSIPDLTKWKKTWQFEGIKAIPDLNRSQSVVDFQMTYSNSTTGELYTAEFHTEIRWSHGKFSSVEGKLYKEFNWINLPFFETIIG
jgi:hypothetical protein